MPKKIKVILPSPKEHYEQLNACINCIYENECNEQLPFPLNLCEHCSKYVKIKKDFCEE